MNALTLSSQVIADPLLAEFNGDMVDLFAGIRGGHVARHAFAGPKAANDNVRGSIDYAEFLRTCRTYRRNIYLKELQLLTAFSDTVAELCGDTENFVEAGVGTIDAFMKKTYPLLSRIAARHGRSLRYIIADVCNDFVEPVARHIQVNQMPLETGFIQGNFFGSLPQLERNSLLYCVGITFTNIPTDALRGDTENIIKNTLGNFAHVLGNGGAFVFTYSASQDGCFNQALYNNPLFSRFQLSMFHRVKRDLDVDDRFNPYNFEPDLQRLWHRERHLLTRHAVVKQPMSFNLNGREFLLEGGQSLYLGNSFRPTDELMIACAKAVGFTPHIFRIPGSSLRLAVLKR